MNGLSECLALCAKRVWRHSTSKSINLHAGFWFGRVWLRVWKQSKSPRDPSIHFRSRSFWKWWWCFFLSSNGKGFKCPELSTDIAMTERILCARRNGKFQSFLKNGEVTLFLLSYCAKYILEWFWCLVPLNMDLHSKRKRKMLVWICIAQKNIRKSSIHIYFGFRLYIGLQTWF